MRFYLKSALAIAGNFLLVATCLADGENQQVRFTSYPLVECVAVGAITKKDNKGRGFISLTVKKSVGNCGCKSANVDLKIYNKISESQDKLGLVQSHKFRAVGDDLKIYLNGDVKKMKDIYVDMSCN